MCRERGVPKNFVSYTCLDTLTRIVPALNSVSSFVMTVSPTNVTTFGSLFLNMHVVLSAVVLNVSMGFAETGQH